VIAYKAAYLLGDLRAKQAVPALLARLKEPPRGDMQRSILVALGQIGEPSGVDAALAVLKDGKQKAEHRQSACDAVVASREMRALPVLLGIAKDGKSPANLRVAAAMALGRLGGKAEAEAFGPIAKSEGYAEFNEVMERLDVAKGCPTGADECYIKALDAPKLTHQEKAAFMLGAAKNRPAALKALVAHLTTPEPVIRLAILDSLRRLADKSCTDCQAKL
jgi:HEAT repeat protein